MGLSLRNITKKIWDQVNPADNGRTWSNPKGNAPQQRGRPAPSAFQQLTHNGLTNTVGNFAVKPAVATVDAATVEPARALLAFATQNNQAFDASKAREIEAIKTSIPGVVGNQLANTGQAGYNLGFKAPALDLMGKDIAAEQARTVGLRQFNQTAPGQLTRPVQFGIANLAHAPQSMQAEVGLNPDSTGAQKYFADPAMGAVGTAGLVATAGVLGKVRPKSVPELPTVTKAPVAQAGEGGAVNIPVKVNKKIDVRKIPDQQELADRYNAHMANLSKEFSKNQKQVTLAGKPGKQGILAEDSVYNDVGYQFKKQQIEEAYRDGTLGKPIPIQDASSVKPTVVSKEKAQLKALQAKPNPTKAEQIKEAILLDKAGQKPTVQAASPELSIPENMGNIKAPGAIDRAWLSVRGAIDRHGAGGQEVSRRLGEVRSASETGQAQFLESIPSVQKLKKAEFGEFVDTLDRLSKGEQNIEGVNPKVQSAVGEWQKAIPAVRDRATKAGLDVGDLGPNYFPRQYKDLFKGGEALKNYAQQLVDEGGAKNIGEAMDKLHYMRQEYTRPFGNLEKTREANLSGYEKTPEAMTNYISRSFKRIAHAEQFGAKNEILNELKTKMAQEGYDISPGGVLDKNLKIAFEDVDKQTAAHKVSGGIRTVNAFRSLGGAGIANATQLPVNTSTIAGIGRTAKGIVTSAVSKTAREEARQTGVLLDHSISNIAQQQLGAKGKIATNIASPFFHKIEKFNRQATAIVGKDFGNSLAKKAVNGNEQSLEMLQKLGVKGEIGSKLTREQEIQASRGLVEAAQFKVDPMDLPGWVDSPAGKLVAQFRTFQYKQTDFMYNHVLKEATRGNFLPLTRFVLTGVPAGTAALAARGVLKGNNPFDGGENQTPEQQGLGIAGKALSQVGGPGLVGGTILNLMDSAKYDNLTGGIAGALGGPTVSGIVETTQNLDKGVGKGNWNPLMKEGVRQLPTLGPLASQKLFPKKDYKQGDAAMLAGDKLKGASLEEIQASDKAEIDKFKKTNKGGGYGLTKTASGKYIYQIGNEVKTSDDLKKARAAIAKDSFGKSKEDIKVVGDKVYYKDSQGDVHTQDKALYDYNQQDSKNKLELDRAYESGDFEKWMGLAENEYNTLEKKKQFYNPKTEQDKIDDITLAQENLIQKAQGYQEKLGKGKGFGAHKASSGGGGSRGGGGGGSRVTSVGSDFEYAVSPTKGMSEARTRFTVAKPAAGRVTAYKASKPKVSLKKSKV